MNNGIAALAVGLAAATVFWCWQSVKNAESQLIQAERKRTNCQRLFYQVDELIDANQAALVVAPKDYDPSRDIGRAFQVAGIEVQSIVTMAGSRLGESSIIDKGIQIPELRCTLQNTLEFVYSLAESPVEFQTTQLVFRPAKVESSSDELWMCSLSIRYLCESK